MNPLELPGGYTVRGTGVRVLEHDGSPHHGVGILPAVPVERTRAAVAAGRDELLERALEVVSRARLTVTRPVPHPRTLPSAAASAPSTPSAPSP
jgi:C-terminal processing protease CtpA/Prc